MSRLLERDWTRVVLLLRLAPIRTIRRSYRRMLLCLLPLRWRQDCLRWQLLRHTELSLQLRKCLLEVVEDLGEIPGEVGSVREAVLGESWWRNWYGT